MPEPAAAATFAKLLAEARRGSREALGQALEGCRQYLAVVARHVLPARLRPRVSESELVQEVMKKALQNFAQFQGESEGQWLGWLRAILQNTLSNFVEFHTAGRRNIHLEVESPGQHSTCDGQLGEPAAHGPSPSSAARATERAAAVQKALAQLPEPYRLVVELYWRDGLTFDQIGRRTGLTADAMRKRWVEALRRMQQTLEKTHGAD